MRIHNKINNSYICLHGYTNMALNELSDKKKEALKKAIADMKGKSFRQIARMAKSKFNVKLDPKK